MLFCFSFLEKREGQFLGSVAERTVPLYRLPLRPFRPPPLCGREARRVSRKEKASSLAALPKGPSASTGYPSGLSGHLPSAEGRQGATSEKRRPVPRQRCRKDPVPAQATPPAFQATSPLRRGGKARLEKREGQFLGSVAERTVPRYRLPLRPFRPPPLCGGEATCQTNPHIPSSPGAPYLHQP